MEDPHLSEYVPDEYQRVKLLSNFSGSSGKLLVFSSKYSRKSLFYTDSRYYLQADKELNLLEWEVMKMDDASVPSLNQYISKDENLKVVAIDPWVHSISSVNSLKKACPNSEISFVDVFNDHDKFCIPSDDIRLESIRIHPIDFAGRSLTSKIKYLRSMLLKKGCCCTVISKLDEIAWILNLRGSDIPCNPVFLSYLFVSQGWLIITSFDDHIFSNLLYL